MDHDDGLLAIEVDTDDYAETAASDTPTVPRTFQSEADFQTQRAGYSAKIDDGNLYRQLLQAIPILQLRHDTGTTERQDQVEEAKTKLSKKDVQLLGYAVGELYYDRQYAKLYALCEKISDTCEADGKTAEALDGWKARCGQKMRSVNGKAAATA